LERLLHVICGCIVLRKLAELQTGACSLEALSISTLHHDFVGNRSKASNLSTMSLPDSPSANYQDLAIALADNSFVEYGDITYLLFSASDATFPGSTHNDYASIEDTSHGESVQQSLGNQQNLPGSFSSAVPLTVRTHSGEGSILGSAANEGLPSERRSNSELFKAYYSCKLCGITFAIKTRLESHKCNHLEVLLRLPNSDSSDIRHRNTDSGYSSIDAPRLQMSVADKPVRFPIPDKTDDNEVKRDGHTSPKSTISDTVSEMEVVADTASDNDRGECESCSSYFTSSSCTTCSTCSCGNNSHKGVVLSSLLHPFSKWLQLRFHTPRLRAPTQPPVH
jgi:hypothetical protein